ncbi:hypothetical protein L202_04316 [Cryptococcus amylolentus CBS 6039]|uniref:Uncharacterized protein n=2 Tax=Cryptococcus amylolentus TaxID=104669 RepID=A0A1E3HQY8_9TREE|nr:hypothetical protein L202_04316 [Cryptococcus amylolentus CBS 6039]ODN78754.1 hypothetical protein L202_04316 [Cryptococcus amylolentus CBS 6039]ODO06744.1 hypothetical protein I350_04103 [Cryptococcus amylolentus CBS 6273]
MNGKAGEIGKADYIGNNRKTRKGGKGTRMMCPWAEGEEDMAVDEFINILFRVSQASFPINISPPAQSLGSSSGSDVPRYDISPPNSKLPLESERDAHTSESTPLLARKKTEGLDQQTLCTGQIG